MVEDQLSPSQRVRLESISQANALMALSRRTEASTEELIKRAKKIERYIIEGNR